MEFLSFFGHFHTIMFGATCGVNRWKKVSKNVTATCIVWPLLSALTWNSPILGIFGTVSNFGILPEDFQESSQNCSIFPIFRQNTLQPFVHNVRKFQASSIIASKIVVDFPRRPRTFGPKNRLCLLFTILHLLSLKLNRSKAIGRISLQRISLESQMIALSSGIID